MEEKKLDLNSIIGFGLIFVILIWVMYNSQQNEAKERAEYIQQLLTDLADVYQPFQLPVHSKQEESPDETFQRILQARI